MRNTSANGRGLRSLLQKTRLSSSRRVRVTESRNARGARVVSFIAHRIVLTSSWLVRRLLLSLGVISE